MAIIDYSDPTNPIFRHVVRNEVTPQEFSFSLRPVQEDQREWLVKVVSTHLDEAFKLGHYAATQEFKANLKKALMLD